MPCRLPHRTNIFFFNLGVVFNLCFVFMSHPICARAQFTNLVRDLDAPGELAATKSYQFDFSNVDKQYDSYSGAPANMIYQNPLRPATLRIDTGAPGATFFLLHLPTKHGLSFLQPS